MPLQKDSKGELPFIFTYRDTVVVHGAIAEVVIRGHLLAVLEARDDGSDGVWIYGVQPGDLSACGDTFGETHAEFRQSFTAVLYDIADSSSSEKEFQAAVQAFFDQVNKPVATAWWEAVEAGRAAGLAFAMKKKMPIGSADTPPSLQLGFSVQENTLETGPELAA